MVSVLPKYCSGCNTNLLFIKKNKNSEHLYSQSTNKLSEAYGIGVSRDSETNKIIQHCTSHLQHFKIHSLDTGCRKHVKLMKIVTSTGRLNTW